MAQPYETVQGPQAGLTQDILNALLSKLPEDFQRQQIQQVGIPTSPVGIGQSIQQANVEGDRFGKAFTGEMDERPFNIPQPILDIIAGAGAPAGTQITPEALSATKAGLGRAATGVPPTQPKDSSAKEKTFNIEDKIGKLFDDNLKNEMSEKKKSFIGNLLKYGIPLAAAGIGTAVPGALAGASGFTQGFVGETSRQQQLTEKAAATQKATEGELAKTVREEDAKIRLERLKASLKADKPVDLKSSFAFIKGVKWDSSKEEKAVKGLLLDKISKELTPKKKITEADIKFMMKKHNMTEDQVLEALTSRTGQ